METLEVEKPISDGGQAIKSKNKVSIDMPKALRVSPDFQIKIYKYSKKFMYCHAGLSCILALTYSAITIFSTNEWQAGLQKPGWHINGGFMANTIFANVLAVAVNLNLCFSALLVMGFHKQSRRFIWLWYVGQFCIEILVTAVLILSILYDCKAAALMACPVFLYYAFALSFFRHVLASTAIRRNKLSSSSASTPSELASASSVADLS